MQPPARPGTSVIALILASMGFAACANPSHPARGIWPATARVAADSLEESGYACREEGRELYPMLYACSWSEEPDSSGIYLYANDRNDLVGIRVFARETNKTVFQEALRLAYTGPMPSNLFPPADQEWQLELSDDLIVEAGGPVSSRHLRITPKKRIIPQP